MTEDDMNMEAEQTPLDQADVEALHNLLVGVDMLLENLGKQQPEIFGNGLAALATYLVEKIYLCSPTMEDAISMFQHAQDQGLDNFIRSQEVREEPSRIVTLDS